MQQFLPFTVLKQRLIAPPKTLRKRQVATVLTVYGIETICCFLNLLRYKIVATVLTVYGIETTLQEFLVPHVEILLLQQHLPSTELKQTEDF